MNGVKIDDNKRVKGENNFESLRPVMISLHAGLLSEYGIFSINREPLGKWKKSGG